MSCKQCCMQVQGLCRDDMLPEAPCLKVRIITRTAPEVQRDVSLTYYKTLCTVLLLRSAGQCSRQGALASHNVSMLRKHEDVSNVPQAGSNIAIPYFVCGIMRQATAHIVSGGLLGQLHMPVGHAVLGAA